jgi:hypothetical protein
VNHPRAPQVERQPAITSPRRSNEIKTGPAARWYVQLGSARGECPGGQAGFEVDWLSEFSQDKDVRLRAT